MVRTPSTHGPWFSVTRSKGSYIIYTVDEQASVVCGILSDLFEKSNDIPVKEEYHDERTEVDGEYSYEEEKEGTGEVMLQVNIN